MISFKKTFRTTVLSITLTLFVECFLAFLLIMIWAAIYYVTEYEPLNSGASVWFVKGFLILLPSIYNVKKINAALKVKDFVAVVGFIGITVVYSILIALLGGGGR